MFISLYLSFIIISNLSFLFKFKVYISFGINLEVSILILSSSFWGNFPFSDSSLKNSNDIVSFLIRITSFGSFSRIHSELEYWLLQ